MTNLQQKVGETIESFADRCRIAVRRAFPNLPQDAHTHLCIEKFAKGIANNQIREKIALEQFQTLDTATQRAKRVEEFYLSNTYPPVNNIQNIQQHAYQYCSICGGNHPTNMCRKNTVCGYCEKLGHYAEICRSRLQNNVQRRARYQEEQRIPTYTQTRYPPRYPPRQMHPDQISGPHNRGRAPPQEYRFETRPAWHSQTQANNRQFQTQPKNGMGARN